MFSACEDCLSVFPADMNACPVCHQATEWLEQTYSVDGPLVTTTLDPSSSVAVK